MNRYGLATAVFLAPALMFGCAKQPATMVTAAPAPTGVAGVSPMAGNPASTSTQSTATSEAPQATGQRGSAAASGERPAPSEFVPVRDLVDIHFDFDQYTIRPRDAEILDANARWLRANANALVLIEGHCDERGTEEYNLALGDRRAKAALSYLVAQGIAPARLVTISYGKERPQCADHNEACWTKNRRAHFLVKRG
jgi:peptidoglycan-associated lipoprotein